MTDVRIEPLNAGDAPRYNSFLSMGAAEHPGTLRIAPEDVHAAPFTTEDGPNGSTFVALDPMGEWLGIVTVEREQGRAKRRHIAWILRMYVLEASAGRGIGRALLTRALDRARGLPGVTKVNLTVAEHNERAVQLYESCGFRSFAREVDAFRDREPRTELTMSLLL